MTRLHVKIELGLVGQPPPGTPDSDSQHLCDTQGRRASARVARELPGLEWGLQRFEIVVNSDVELEQRIGTTSLLLDEHRTLQSMSRFRTTAYTCWPDALQHFAGIGQDVDATPLFRSMVRKTKLLTARAVTANAIYRMVKRRLRNAGGPSRYLSCHSFRATAITDLLTQGVPLEEVQYLAGHRDPRTTRLYDRRQKQVTRNIVERISV